MGDSFLLVDWASPCGAKIKPWGAEVLNSFWRYAEKLPRPIGAQLMIVLDYRQVVWAIEGLPEISNQSLTELNKLLVDFDWWPQPIEEGMRMTLAQSPGWKSTCLNNTYSQEFLVQDLDIS